MFLRTKCRSPFFCAAAVVWALSAHGQQTLTQDSDAAVKAGRLQSAEVGIATVYAAELEGQSTASGELYGAEDLTAAHRSYPLGTRLRIIAMRSGDIVTVRVNDRWRGGAGRIVNLSRRAARELGFGSSSTMEVRIEVDELGTNIPTRREAPMARVFSDVAVVETQGSTSRSRQCARQANILGLQNDWAARHVRTCLANRLKI